LDDEEAAIGRHLNGLPHRFRVELGDWAMRPRTGVIHNYIGFTELLVRILEQACDPGGLRRVHLIGLRAGLSGKRRQLVDIARRQSDLETGRCQTAGQ
jgi:hypothetical protein